MTIICSFIGHKLGDLQYVRTNIADADGTLKDNSVGYTARVCQRCDKRIAVTVADAERQAIIASGISRIMNGERARYGLKPIKWDA